MTLKAMKTLAVLVKYFGDCEQAVVTNADLAMCDYRSVRKLFMANYLGHRSFNNHYITRDGVRALVSHPDYPFSKQ